MATEDLPQIPGYRVERQLGQGGMATVYLAVQESFGRQVALKIMSDKLGQDSVWAKRFIHEAQVIAQLSHPNIIPVFDVGTHEGQFYISMEYMKGGTLPDRMNKGIPIPQVLQIIAGVAAGLDFAGEKGFVHRDIKPDNVMFREDGSPVILDFGIVKQVGDGDNKMTQTGTIVGTTTYMSPEQALGKELDERSDIYSLGIMFYELLTGQAPFRGESAMAVLFKHVNEEHQPLPEALDALRPVLDKALAKKPEDRYNRARELIEHLQSLEQDIKTMLAKQEKTAVFNQADEATVIQASLDNMENTDATIVANPAFSNDGGGVDHKTQELEITRVLSSAKATIKDFSQEARLKKAKRTKRLIASMSLVAMSAISYVGYHQFYVIPQEQAAAEAKIRDAELRTQKKIEELHAEAKAASKNLKLSELAEADKVISIYRQILKIDPENQDAQSALDQMGTSYIELANKSLLDDALEQAETYRDYALQLSPSNQQLAALRESIQKLRAINVQQALGNKFKQEQIATLLTVAKTDIEKSEAFSDSAYTKLQQVLRLDPENSEASKLTETMLDKLVEHTASAIERGSLSRARQNINTLEKYYENNTQIGQLKSDLKSANTRLSSQKNLNSLQNKVAKLKRERRTIAVNDELRELYLSILRIEPKNKSAKKGIIETSDFDIKLAQQAIKDREYDRAKQQIEIVTEFTPKHKSLKSVKSELKLAQDAAADADGMLEKAKALISKSANGENKRANLKQATSLVENAKKTDPNNPNISSTTSALETEYISDIKKLMTSENTKLLSAYFADAAGKTWPTERIFNLQQTQKNSTKTKPKKKRVIVGGF